MERRHLAAVPELVLAVAIVLLDVPYGELAAALIVVDFLVQLVRWPVPRRLRSGRSYWAETVLSLAPLALLLPLGLALGAEWASALPHPAWFAAAPPVAAALLLLSRLDVAAVLSGDLAFLAGPDKPAHAAARATGAFAGPIGEEALFRGAGIALPSPNPVLVPLSVAAFVTRHHVLAGVRRDARDLAVEVTGAVAFTALAIASSSLYPGLLAHLLHNMPNVFLEGQIARRNVNP